MRDVMLRCLDRLTDTLFLQMGSSYDVYASTVLEFQEKVRVYCDEWGISMVEGATSSDVLLGFGEGRFGSVNLNVADGQIFIYDDAKNVTVSTISAFDGDMKSVTESVRGRPA